MNHSNYSIIQWDDNKFCSIPKLYYLEKNSWEIKTTHSEITQWWLFLKTKEKSSHKKNDLVYHQGQIIENIKLDIFYNTDILVEE